MVLRKHGGMHFWRIGRFGGSFYVAKPKTEWQRAFHDERWLVRSFVVVSVLAVLL